MVVAVCLFAVFVTKLLSLCVSSVCNPRCVLTFVFLPVQRELTTMESDMALLRYVYAPLPALMLCSHV